MVTTHASNANIAIIVTTVIIINIIIILYMKCFCCILQMNKHYKYLLSL